ncbi:MAG: aspartate/glutamate racemase family protein [Clostridiales bacterium]|nr:aspartate/glutamate racemase family protein [Clostridiales bacterium]
MKTAGLLRGMSWESTLEYYRIMNEEVKERLGGSHSTKLLMYSFDFKEIEDLQHAGKWKELTAEMVSKASNLKAAGADFIVICTNTMHLMASDIENETGLKVVHIAEATGEEIVKKGLRKVGLLGTRFTMEGDFYREIIKNKYGVEVIIPEEADRKIVHDIIYNELVKGIITQESKEKYVATIDKLSDRGAEGVILGCTEIPLLIKQDDVDIVVFDTTAIHSKAAVAYALNGDDGND